MNEVSQVHGDMLAWIPMDLASEHHEHGAERNANDGARSAISHESGEKWREARFHTKVLFHILKGGIPWWVRYGSRTLEFLWTM